MYSYRSICAIGVKRSCQLSEQTSADLGFRRVKSLTHFAAVAHHD